MSKLGTEQRMVLDTLLAQCESSLGEYARLFHSDRFTRPFSPHHEKLFKAVNDESQQKLLIIAHRGFGKSSIFNYAFPSWQIMYEKSPYIMPLSATASLAVRHSDNLRRELTTNAKIKGVIGNITSDQFSRELWVTQGREKFPEGIMLNPRSVGQQVRGELHGNHRPRTLLPDDLETMEMVRSEEQRDKMKSWFFSDLMNCVDRPLNKWRCIVTGTILHEDSLLQHLRDDPTWNTLEFPVCDENFNPYWPEFMTKEQILAMKEEAENQNKLDLFYLEYLNVVNPKELQVFRGSYFRYFDPDEMDFTDSRYESIIVVDPARSLTNQAAKTSIVGITWDMRSEGIYVRDIVNERIMPDEIYTQAFDMADRIGAKVLGWDDYGLKEFIRQGVRNEMTRRGRYYEIEWLESRTAKTRDRGVIQKDVKEARIGCLLPYYRMGQVYHAKGVCAELEQQLLSYPYSRFSDVMDALSYVIQMLEFGERYMEQTFEDEDKQLLDDYEREDRAFEKLMGGLTPNELRDDMILERAGRS